MAPNFESKHPVLILAPLQGSFNTLVERISQIPRVECMQTSSSPDALAFSRLKRPAIALMDGGVSGSLEACKHIRHYSPTTRIYYFPPFHDPAELSLPYVDVIFPKGTFADADVAGVIDEVLEKIEHDTKYDSRL